MQKYRWSVMSTLLALVTLLAACGGRLTIGGVTFGKSRTPPTVVTVSNTDPTPYSSKSQNWAGFFLQARAVTAISGTWQVPQVNGPAESDSSTWIGIGGVKNNSLIQAGTDQLMQNGKPYYFAWIELLPALPMQVKEIDLLPGDTVTFTITYQNANQWAVVITDKDANESVTKHETYASCLCSAEWIEEAPSLQGQQSPLANFTSVTFAHLSVTYQGHTLTPSLMCPRVLLSKPQCMVPLRMVDANGNTMAQPQVLHNGGFSVVDVPPTATSGG